MQIAFTYREPARHVRRGQPSLPRRKMIVVGALSALLLAGCGSGSTTTNTEGTMSGGAPAKDSVGRSGASVAPSAAPADVAKSGTPVVGVGPKLTKSASLDLQVKDIATAAARVRGVAAGLQAQVLSEQIGTGSPGDPTPLRRGSDSLGGFGTLTLSVPADKLDSALDQLAKIGTVQRRNTTSQD